MSRTTLRTIQVELAELGTKVSYGAIWNFVHADGLKKTVMRMSGCCRKAAQAHA